MILVSIRSVPVFVSIYDVAISISNTEQLIPARFDSCSERRADRLSPKFSWSSFFLCYHSDDNRFVLSIPLQALVLSIST